MRLAAALPRLVTCLVVACLLVSLPRLATSARAESLLATVKSRGDLVCGVSSNSAAYSMPDSQGVFRGLDADFCRVIAAAVFGDATRVKFRALTSMNRFTALQTGEVDVLFQSSTWTMGRETVLGLRFAAVNYFGGMGILSHATLGITHASEMSGATICTSPGSTNEVNLQEYFRLHGGSFQPVIIENNAELIGAFTTGRCDAWAQDAATLAAFRMTAGGDKSPYTLLPDNVTMEPLGAFVRPDDPVWLNVVRWSLLATVAAEQSGITRANVDGFAASKDAEARRILGLEGDLGTSIGIDPRFAYQIVKQVGSYADIWTANIGPTGVARGLNRLWNQGGLMYSPPMR